MISILRRSLAVVLAGIIVLWPIAPIWSAPATSSTESNLGPLSLGGTAAASSSYKTFGPNQAFDGVFFATTKASSYEDGWIAKTGSGAWIERDWPGRVNISGVTITRRSNQSIDLCSKARQVSIDVGIDAPTVVTLADTNAPQYFPVVKNSIHGVRVTVLGVEGIGCLAGSVGFSEIELYGTPKSWTPSTQITSAALTMSTVTLPDNQLQFIYDTSIPLDSQAYLTTLTTQLLPVMTEVLGPPLTSQTLTVKLNPAYGSFTYAAGLSTLTISHLPNASLPISDPNNWDFNSSLTHEVAHAYQAGYGFSAPAWFREGFAQAAADVVKQVFNERGMPLMQNNITDEGQAIRTYDTIAAMGPEVLSAAWDGNSRIIPYINAEGLWWLLMLSQSSPRPNGTYAEIDYLRRVETGLYQYAPDSSDAARRNFLANLSPNLIDGRPASQWLMRQPIVQSAPYQNALGFYPGDCFCSQTVTAEARHLVIFWRGQFGDTGSIPVHVTLRDAAGAVQSDETVMYTDYGFGFYFYTWPIMIEQLPAGRYDITVEATVDGVPLRATQSIARGSYSLDSTSGLSVTERQASALNPLSITSPIGSYQQVSQTNGRVVNLPSSPLDLPLFVNNRTVPDTVFWPAPYTRYITLP